MNLVTKQALLDEVDYEEQLYKEMPLEVKRLNGLNYNEERTVREAFIQGLKRAAEMCDQPEFQPEPSYEELEALTTHAENIINSLLDIIEKECPTTYSGSEEVTHADDWLKWINGELMNTEIKEYFNYPL